MTGSDQNRAIADLEVQMAHQAKQLDELNEIVRKQWDEIDRLTRSLTHVAERLLGIETGDQKNQPGEDPAPPHY